MEDCQNLVTLKNEPLLSHIPVILLITTQKNAQKGYVVDTMDCIDKTKMHSQLPLILTKYKIGDNSTKSVMLIDDDDIIRESMTSIIESHGLRVFQAENGEVALEFLGRKKPALLLLDINMPTMDGFEFIKHLRKNKQWNSIPIVVLTSRNLTVKEQMYLNQHVTTIFKKNFYQKDDLIAHIHKLISN